MTKVQRSYTEEYRANAVTLASEVGATKAAQQLRIPHDTLYGWLKRARKGDLPMSAVPPDPKSSISLAQENKELRQEVQRLKAENRQIQRENEILEHATAFFAARRKKSGNA